METAEMEAKLDRRKQQREARQYWVKPWLGDKRVQHEYCNQLLRSHNQASYINFLKLSTAMFDELLARLTSRLTKPQTYFRETISPYVMVTITLRHLANQESDTSLRFGFRVASNTISKLA